MSESTTAQVNRPQSTTAALIAGSFGGAAQVLVGQPLDTIKTRAQTAKPGLFKGATDIAIQTIRKEGVFALYKGMSSPLLGVAFVNSLLFASNQFARKLISPYPNLNYYQIGAAGAIAGAIQAVAASPVEMFKIRMQANYQNGGSLRKEVSSIYSEYGWRKGIMRGYWVRENFESFEVEIELSFLDYCFERDSCVCW